MAGNTCGAGRMAMGEICPAHPADFPTGDFSCVRLRRRLGCPRNRAVAQLGRAPRSGRGSRRFKSCRPDHLTRARLRQKTPRPNVAQPTTRTRRASPAVAGSRRVLPPCFAPRREPSFRSAFPPPVPALLKIPRPCRG
jgi:hypothetical protein